MSDSEGEHVSPDQSSFVNRVAAVMLVKKQTSMIPGGVQKRGKHKEW